ncbi:MAG: molybdopterin-dependent oxidoreductase [Pseudolysinimonas sp.]|uniref:molybdopterin-dependent oxidoreductase n=1 Tax=Pseudolysinimonas sp. TaxID=2680009 RepID=UPI003263CE3B
MSSRQVSGDPAKSGRVSLSSRWLWPSISGVVSVAFGLGVAELVAGVLAPAASPVLVVGSLLIDLAPPWAKDAAISLFGTGDKAALLTGIAVALALVAAAAGVLQNLRPPIGRVLIIAGGLFGMGAAITRAGSSIFDSIPAAVAMIAASVALTALLRRKPSDTPKATDVSRRRFLGWAGGATALGALGALGGFALQAGARAATAVRSAIHLPAPSTAAAPVPAAADFGIDGLSPIITPNREFYRIDTALQVPIIDPTTWSLRIHGLVENEVVITWDELLALPLEESITTLMCVSNEVGGSLIGNARWLGYPIRHLLERAKPKSGANMVFSKSSDGFTASTPIEALQDDRNAILAVGMNGELLPLEHGFPVRMVVPGLYGYVSATKWVTDLEVTTFSAAAAYWTVRGWSDHGPIKISSRIDVPNRNTAAGDVVVAGVAWHQHTGISKVEVQVDDGPWREAELATAISADTWVQWRYTWNATSGSHVLRCRATGSDGEVQTSALANVVPDGATGLHEVQVSIG